MSGYVPDRDYLRSRALLALDGIGDAQLWQLESWSGYAYHIRRRLTEREERKVGPAVDIRGTDEQIKRWLAVRPFVPINYRDFKE